MELKQRYIECFDVDDPYDVLLDDFERGMTHGRDGTRAAGQLKDALLPLLAEVRAQRRRRRRLAAARQLPDRPAARVRDATCCARCRCRPSAGGWTTPRTRSRPRSRPTDVRITTRYSERNLAAVALQRAARVRSRPVRERHRPLARAARRCAGPHRSACTSPRAACGRTSSGAAAPFWRPLLRRSQRAFPEQLGRAQRSTASTARSTRCSRR